jgi:processive 1,2-diacylglycerol beta-glucosyltransferase
MKISLWYAELGEDRQTDLIEGLTQALSNGVLGPDVQIEAIDIVSRWRRPFSRTILSGGYAAVLDWMPRLWDMLYEHRGWQKRLTSARQRVMAFEIDQIVEYIKDSGVDIVIGCHPLSLLPAAQAKHYCQESGQGFVLLALTAAFHFHFLYWQPGVSLYALLHHQQEKEWLEQGVPKEKLRVLGLPLREVFRKPLSRSDAREQLRLPQGEVWPIVLFGADVLDGLDIGELIGYLRELGHSVRWWFYYDRDRELAEHLKREASNAGVYAKMFGHQADLSIFYAAADLVVTKAKVVTAVEILACRTPLLLWSPRVGSESCDAQFLSDMGVAHILHDLDRSGDVWEQVLDYSALSELQRRVELLSSLDGSEGITQLVAEVIAHKPEIVQRDIELWPEEVKKFKRIMEPSSDGQSVEPVVQSSEGAASVSADRDHGIGPFEEIGIGDQASEDMRRDPDSWKRAYVELKMSENRLQRELEDIDEQLSVWQERLDLAQKYEDSELQGEAKQRVKRYQVRRDSLHRDWERNRQRKEQLQQKLRILREEQRDTAGAEGRDLLMASDNTAERARPREHQIDIADPRLEQSDLRSKAIHEGIKSSETEMEHRFRKLAMDDKLAQLKQQMRIDRSQIDLSRLRDEDE